MKIGLLTYFWDENPGTMLQAYSLVKALTKFFPNADVELINYRHTRHKIRLIRNYFKYKVFYDDCKRKIVYNIFKSHHLRLSKRRLVSKNYNEAVSFIADNKYDIIISGSDTIWQLSKNKILPSFPNVYWLPCNLNCKKIAFAVSSNITRYEDLSLDHKAKMRSVLSQYDLIGVRDSMTLNIVNSLGIENKGKLMRVPDPTFLSDLPNTDIEKDMKRQGINLHKPILGISYPASAPLCAEIVKKYKAMGFQILSFTHQFPCSAFMLPCLNPFEWADVFKYLDFVITDRFHGAVFSLKNRVPVLAVDWHSYRYDKHGNSKTLSLMRDFGLADTNHINMTMTDHNLDLFFEKAEMARKNFDEKLVGSKVNELRQNGLEYLNKIKSIL